MKFRYQMRGLGIGIILTALLMGVATGGGLPLSDAEIRARALELGMVDGGSLKLTDISGSDGGEADSVPESGGGTVSGNISGGESEAEDALGPADIGSLAGREGEDGTTESPAAGREGEDGTTESPAAGREGEDGTTESPAAGREGEDGTTESPAAGREGEGDIAESHMPEDTETPGTEGAGDSRVKVVIEPGIKSLQVCELLADAGLVGDAYAYDRFLCENGYSTQIRHGSYEFEPGISQEELTRIITGGR